MSLSKSSIAAALCLSLSLFFGVAGASEADRDQAITIHADQAEHNEQTGTTTYTGEVVMQQGSMRIEADQVVIHSERNRVIKIIAQGRPARYQQKPSESEGLVVAQAQLLEYNISQDTLHLIDDALLQQDGTSLSGSRIDYDVHQSVVKAGSRTDQNERVRMVIPARSIHREDNE